MKAARIALSAALGISLFYCSSALAQMSSISYDADAQQPAPVGIQNISSEDETYFGAALLYEDFEHQSAEEPELKELPAGCVTGVDYDPGEFVPLTQDERIKLLEEGNISTTGLVPLKVNAARTNSFCKSDMLLMARVVYAESRGEKFEGQVAVATVVINRYRSGLFGKTVSSIVFAPNQFAITGRHNSISLKAVESALEIYGDYPYNMFYFRTSKDTEWRNFVYYKRIGGHSFYCSPD